MEKNQKTLTPLLQQLNLGKLITVSRLVTDGLSHQIWQLKTTTGCYALKVLSEATMKSHRPVEVIIQGEVIARLLKAKGIPALGALWQGEQCVFAWQGRKVLVVPWVDNVVVTPTVKEARQIGVLLARIHQLDLSLEINDYLAKPAYGQQFWRQLLPQITTGFRQQITLLLPELLKINQLCLEQPLQTDIVSHNDLNPTNVLWQSLTQPRIIDWEAAGRVHRKTNILSLAIDWATLLSTQPQWALFSAVLEGYRSLLPLPRWQRRAYLQVKLQWVNWLAVQLESLVIRQNTTSERAVINAIKILTQLIEQEKFFRHYYQQSC